MTRRDEGRGSDEGASAPLFGGPGPTPPRPPGGHGARGPDAQPPTSDDATSSVPNAPSPPSTTPPTPPPSPVDTPARADTSPVAAEAERVARTETRTERTAGTERGPGRLAVGVVLGLLVGALATWAWFGLSTPTVGASLCGVLSGIDREALAAQVQGQPPEVDEELFRLSAASDLALAVGEQGGGDAEVARAGGSGLRVHLAQADWEAVRLDLEELDGLC